MKADAKAMLKKKDLRVYCERLAINAERGTNEPYILAAIYQTFWGPENATKESRSIADKVIKKAKRLRKEDTGT